MAGDLSNSAHTLTWNGSVQTSGEEIILDGSSAYLSSPDHANWQLDGDFTIEIFGAKFADDTVVQDFCSHYEQPGESNQRGWLFSFAGQESPKRLRFTLSTDGTSGTTTFIDANWSPTLNQAYDVCVERSGTTLRFYVDGTFLSSDTLSGTSFDSLADFRIGARGGASPSAFWNGRLKALRVTKGTARYATDTSYTVPTLPLPTS